MMKKVVSLMAGFGVVLSCASPFAEAKEAVARFKIGENRIGIKNPEKIKQINKFREAVKGAANSRIDHSLFQSR